MPNWLNFDGTWDNLNGFINVKIAEKVSNSHKDNGYTIKSVT